jgi:hypothetical protein
VAAGGFGEKRIPPAGLHNPTFEQRRISSTTRASGAVASIETHAFLCAIGVDVVVSWKEVKNATAEL